MSSNTRVWAIEILSPRDRFKSYFAGRDGHEPLWVEDPAGAVHFAERREAKRTASTLGLHGHERVVPYEPIKRRPSRRAAPMLRRVA
jgi:hypothetical protein